MSSEMCPVMKGYRKVYVDSESFVYMNYNTVNLPDLIRALWKASPDLPAMMQAFDVVRQRAKKPFSGLIYEGLHRYMVTFPSENLTKSLCSICRAASLPQSTVHDMMATFAWQNLLQLVARNNALSKLDRVKRDIDVAAKELEQISMVDFVQEYPEYKYAASAIAKIPKHDQQN